MVWQATPYTVPLGITTVVATGMFVLAASQRSRKGAYTMMGLFGGMAIYAGAYGLQLASTGVDQKLLWDAFRFAGPAVVTLAFLVFALQYTGRESNVTPRNVAILGAIPATTIVLVWTDFIGLHDLVIAAADVAEIGGVQQLVVENGPWYGVHAMYSILLTLVAIALFVTHWYRSDGANRKRSRLFAISGLVPVVGSALYVAEVTAIDWGPITYVVTGLVLVFAIFYY